MLFRSLVGALKSLPAGASVSGIAAEIDKAFKAGKLSADEYAQAIAIIKVRLDDASPSFLNATEKVKDQGKATKDTEAQTRKAQEAARDYALELEKLARTDKRIVELTDGKEIVKIITVPNKLVNIVVKG